MKWLSRGLFLWLIIFILVMPPIYEKQRTEPIRSRVEKGSSVDFRIKLLHGIFTQRHSPLNGTERDFIRISEEYKLDWKILPSIAGVESGFETNGNIHDYNPFGYMCGSSPCVFDSYQQAIERVAKTISRNNAYEKYRISGSIYALAVPYNYASPEDWTSKVEYFEGELK